MIKHTSTTGKNLTLHFEFILAYFYVTEMELMYKAVFQ